MTQRSAPVPVQRSGLLLLLAAVLLAGLGAVFCFAPLVECRRCERGQFTTEVVWNGKPALYIDYCDCGSIYSLMDTGRTSRIPLLRALRKPRSYERPK